MDTARSREFGFVVAGVLVQLLTLGIIGALWLGLHATGVKFARDVGMGGVIFAAVVLLAVSPALTGVQRHRLRALGVGVPSVAASRWSRFAAFWRGWCYRAVVGPALMVFALPALLVSVVAPRVVGVLAHVDVWAMEVSLGPSRLQRRVTDLVESRAGLVDAADAERRRIERDLHDGAQQQLVSLAVNLGVARAGLTHLPDEARQVIVDAHEQAKEALAELRGLVRGLHPAILDDRGLDAALSGIAARAPIPVRLRVEVPDRASPTVEAVAYFTVTEALTNIAKHARASCAEIDVVRRGEVLVVTVTDDGVGGADSSHGTGLASLAHRARSVDGVLSVSSPAGGPTIVRAELPCGL